MPILLHVGTCHGHHGHLSIRLMVHWICNIKNIGSVSTTRFSGHNQGWPRNLFVELFSICHLKGNMIFVPLTLNSKWIRLVCMWRLFSLWCWWVCQRLVSWVVHFCPEITKTIFVRLYYPGFNAKASDRCWASLIMETQFLCILAFLEIDLTMLVGLLGWLFDEVSAVMFGLFLFPPTYTLCVWIIGTLSMLITRWRYMLTGILYWNIVCIEYQVEMCLQTWLGLSWKDLFTPHFCQSIAWITDDLNSKAAGKEITVTIMCSRFREGWLALKMEIKALVWPSLFEYKCRELQG